MDAQLHPGVIWFTGLPGSGKSTLAAALAERLERAGSRVERLDGDELRELFPRTGFDAASRDEHARRVAHAASLLEKHGVTVVVSLVSPYARSREFARGLCRRFVEIHVSTPQAECERRDPKGLYARARRGEIKDFTGVGDPYETPEKPELALDASRLGVPQAGEIVWERVSRLLGVRR